MSPLASVLLTAICCHRLLRAFSTGVALLLTACHASPGQAWHLDVVGKGVELQVVELNPCLHGKGLARGLLQYGLCQLFQELLVCSVPGACHLVGPRLGKVSGSAGCYACIADGTPK